MKLLFFFALLETVIHEGQRSRRSWRAGRRIAWSSASWRSCWIGPHGPDIKIIGSLSAGRDKNLKHTLLWFWLKINNSKVRTCRQGWPGWAHLRDHRPWPKEVLAPATAWVFRCAPHSLTHKPPFHCQKMLSVIYKNQHMVQWEWFTYQFWNMSNDPPPLPPIEPGEDCLRSDRLWLAWIELRHQLQVTHASA